MTTTATSNIRFGGSGFGPEFFPVKRKRKISGEGEESTSSNVPQSYTRAKRDEVEVFMFTVKEPIRSALNQLMLLIKDLLEAEAKDPLKEPEIPLLASGPLGYNSVRAFRPVMFAPTKSVFRPVLR